MAKPTRELATLWWDWLSTAERLIHTLHEQTAALTLRQVERIENLQPELDGLTQRMQEIDGQAVACAKKLAGDLGVAPNLRSLVDALEKAEAQEIQSIANRVIVVGRNVQQIIAKNRTLVENELDYVNGTMALVAREALEKNSKFRANAPESNVIMNQVA